MAYHVFDRAKRRVQGQREQRQADQGIPTEGRGRALQDLQRHSHDHRQASDPIFHIWRSNCFLLQDVSHIVLCFALTFHAISHLQTRFLNYHTIIYSIDISVCLYV